jgi:hypothetical protein
MSGQSNSNRQHRGRFGNRYDSFDELVRGRLQTPYARLLEDSSGGTGDENQDPPVENSQGDRQPEQPVVDRPDYSHTSPSNGHTASINAGHGFSSDNSAYQSRSTVDSGPNNGNPPLTREPKEMVSGSTRYFDAEFGKFRYWSYDGYHWNLDQHQANIVRCPPVIYQQLVTSNTNSVEREPSQSNGGNSGSYDGYPGGSFSGYHQSGYTRY